MDILYKTLLGLPEPKMIHSIKFLQTASVPIIKLVVDLEVVNRMQITAKIAELEDKKENSDDEISESDKKLLEPK